MAALALLLVGATVTAALMFRQDSKPSWHLAWSDDFNGSALDRSKWSAEDRSTFGEGNLELACLMSRSKNVEVAGGMLTLR
ncbi:MAG: glycoside hydrolase family 16 protein, partial [Jatrophihabitantaceae bacterium]